MITRSKIKNLEKELEKIEPKERPVIFLVKEILDKHDIKNSSPYMRIGYFEGGGDEPIFLPDLSEDKL